jgi:hypothetical protein
LLNTNRDRLFGCWFESLQSRDESVYSNPEVNGLIGGHAYSVLRAVECEGKKFLVIRNPWGESEWTGPWSDGSKEWATKWLQVLPVLNHNFGNDGQFVMECELFRNFFALSLLSESSTTRQGLLGEFQIYRQYETVRFQLDHVVAMAGSLGTTTSICIGIWRCIL